MMLRQLDMTWLTTVGYNLPVLNHRCGGSAGIAYLLLHVQLEHET